MSIGIGGDARLVLQDEEMLIFEYCPYNLNDKRYRNEDRVYDGVITICKDALLEPEIREKLKRMSSGRKRMITKRIVRPVDYEALLASGKIEVENSRFCYKILTCGIGCIAMRLIEHLFDTYQRDGIVKEAISFYY
ncbi:MAG: hypothetical protein IJD51_03720 [Clostridia bacterium]|nr:hypothetical protein [Clostridia bacterium]